MKAGNVLQLDQSHRTESIGLTATGHNNLHTLMNSREEYGS